MKNGIKTGLFLGFLAVAAQVQAATPTTGSFGWGFGVSDPSGPFMTGYSDTFNYQENVYVGGGAIQTNTWQTLSYTLNKRADTITVSVGGSAPATSAYGAISTPTDIFLVFGQGINGADVPFPKEILVRDFEVKFDNVLFDSEEFAGESVGDNLIDGTHAGWTNAAGDGIPAFIRLSPDGFKAVAITDAHGFSGGFTLPDWTFADASNVFSDANTVQFSIQVYWPDAVAVVTGIPEPASLGLMGMGALALVRRRR